MKVIQKFKPVESICEYCNTTVEFPADKFNESATHEKDEAGTQWFRWICPACIYVNRGYFWGLPVLWRNLLPKEGGAGVEGKPTPHDDRTKAK